MDEWIDSDLQNKDDGRVPTTIVSVGWVGHRRKERVDLNKRI